MFSFDHVFRLSVLITSLLGFTALAACGAVHPAIIAAGYAIIALSAFKERLPWQPSPRLWMVFTALSLLVCGAEAFKNMTMGLLYFVICLKISKSWNPQSNRDYGWLFVICFFEVVFATLFTTSLLLMFVFIGFTLSFSVALILFSCKCEIDRAVLAGATLSGGKYGRGDALLSRNFVTRCSAIALALLTFTMLIFIVIPRHSSSRILSRYGAIPGRRLSGFSDDVRLGAIGSIQMDPTVMMRVFPLDSQTRDELLRLGGVRLRGVALWAFDGENWRNPGMSSVYYEYLRLAYQVDFPRPLRRGPKVEVRIYFEPGVSEFLFCPAAPDHIEMPREEYLFVDPYLRSVRFWEAPTEGFSYRAVGLLEPDLPSTRLSPEETQKSNVRRLMALLRAWNWGDLRRTMAELDKFLRGEHTGGVMDGDMAENVSRYLRAPTTIATDPQYRELVSQMRSWNTDRYALASEIDLYLRRNCAYSMSFDHPGVRPPMLEFLFGKKEGHCEYFASAMALLLRSVGIPSRVVNGFYSNEWNPISQHFVVRREHAHSWVEAWFDGYGWKTFDPTPSAAVNRLSSDQTWTALMAWQHWEAMRFRWYRYVVDFGMTEQRTAFMRVWGTFRASVKGVQSSLRTAREAFSPHSSGSPLRSTLLWLLLLAASAMIFIAARYRARMQVSVLARHAAHAPPAIAATLENYELILRHLERLGHRREPSQTPKEFAFAVALRDETLDPLRPVTQAYYAARFGRRALAASEKASMRDFLEALRTKSKRPYRAPNVGR